MNKWLLGLLCTALVAGAFFASSQPSKTEAAAGDKLLAHDVYFKLKDASDASKQKLVDACKKHLSKHPGTVFFAAGTIVPDLAREVNDREFDVSLHIYFQDKASHDQYQDAPRHKQFIEENKDDWSKVRVFDSYVDK